ncbi:DNA polymerase I [Alloprevotella rava]|uniref:DNA polymerase I n=1 Tax=Alloprevotella rava TaxID=671218 RepID=A0A7W5UIV4_9BACT|nr:DNA polymerase I [Alloprevotella rava]MBB3702156.1 DNA polymerase-1 [Alloprevotella rava]
MKKFYLLDAYALIYRAYYGLIRSPRINSKGQNTSAIFGFVSTLNEVLQKEQPDLLAIGFDPSGQTFRHELFPEYKAQREATPEDIKMAVPIIKELIKAYRIPILEVPGFEADDVIGTMAKAAVRKGYEVRMITPDKDYAQLVEPNLLMQRPGHGNVPWEILGPQEVCEKYGLQSPLQVIDYLALMGDAADNIPGCPGVGPKTATTLLQQFGSCEDIITHSSELKGAVRKKIEEHVDEIKLSKVLTTIKTDVPLQYDFEQFKIEEPDKEALRQIFTELEFRSFLTKLDGPQKSSKSAPVELSLFGSESTEDKGDDSERLFSRLENLSYEYKLVDNETEAKELADFLLTNEFFSLDTETTSIEALDAKLVGLSFSTEDFRAWYVPVSRETEKAKKILEIFRPVYENPKILKVGQNLKYDLTVLANYGIHLSGPLFDTMLAHYLIQPELRHNMDYLAEIYLNYKTIHIEELIGPKGRGQKNMGDLEPKDIYKYACEDADVTLRLMKPLAEELRKNGVEEVFQNIEMPLMPVLARMERNGVVLDTETLKEVENDFTARLQTLEKDIYELAGHEFTINSPRQVGEVLFGELKLSEKVKKTKSGQYSTSEEVLRDLHSKHPIVQKILDYRGLKKLLSTYVEALPKLINPATGHIHTSFNQAVTATGRLSSSNPNLQNIPVRGEDGREIRKAFIPEAGEIFFSADYSQIELRIMAHLSGDEHMIEAFNAGHDVHAATAARIFHKDIKDISKDERRKAKTANFGIIYGISAFGLAERMDVSRTEAKELIDSYFEMYPKIKDYISKAVDTAREKGYIETEFGRRRYLPDINSRNAVVRGYAERNAVNAPIQGTAADIIKIAMIRVQQRLDAEGCKARMMLQVHDELNFSVPADEFDKVKRIVIEEMQGAYKMSVPLEADCGEGKNWLEAH